MRPFRQKILRVAAALIAASYMATPAFAAPVTIDECRMLGDAEVEAKIRQLTDTALNSELKDIDYERLVATRWPEARMDERIDKAIDAAVDVLKADKTWLDRAYSNISASTAERYAVEVAERAYASQDFKDALTELANLVGQVIGGRIEKSTEKVSGPVIGCVQKALQTRYGEALAQIFARETEQSIRVNPTGAVSKIDTADLALQGGATLSGIILVVTRQVIARMVTSIGTRIAGAVATRIVSTFTGIVGVALIVSDLYNAGDGVFPLIAERMKSAESKAVIKSEIARSLNTEVTQQLEPIGRETAARIHALWLDFRQKYEKLLQLADQYPAFANFLKARKIDQLGRLGRIVQVISDEEGEKQVEFRTLDGSLNRALLELGASGVTIAESAKSIDAALRWAKLAGDKLDQVTRQDLHTFIKPEDISQAELEKLLAVDDRMAITRIAKLEKNARALLLALPLAQLRDIGRVMSEGELAAYSGYQRQLAPEAARRVAAEIGRDPAAMRTLAEDAVQTGILQSRDQLAAIDMILRAPSPVPDLMRVVNDLDMVSNGRVDWRVFWRRHMFAVIVAGLIGFVLLLWLRRLMFGRAR
jgi:ABC-type transporter MlaC component